MNVLYFTVVPLGSSSNGGNICCKNHVERLAADPNIRLTAMVAGSSSDRGDTERFFADLGVECWFQPIHADNVYEKSGHIGSLAHFAMRCMFHFPWELKSLNQPHIEHGITWTIKGYSIDILIVDYHASALFIDLPRKDVKTVVVGFDREAAFYREQIALGISSHSALTAGISHHRLSKWEERVNASVDQVVVIRASDAPQSKVRRPPICISPYLDRKDARWSYTGSKTLFFVGFHAHYPNKIAIKWLVERLSPALQNVDSALKIAIVGASLAEFPEAAQCVNVQLLGMSDRATVEQMFRTADAFICPVFNHSGVKFKALEALSYGTPLIASDQTLLGLPFLDADPSIYQEDPVGAASLVSSLLNDASALAELQKKQQAQQLTFAQASEGIWSRTLASLLR